MQRLLFGALFLAFCAAVPARADTRAISADPNAPSFRYGWLSGFRGRMGMPILIGGRSTREGWEVALIPMLELHNERGSSSLVPYERWRGRASVELSYSPFDFDYRELWWSLTFALEHESAHRSVRPQPPLVFALSRGSLPAYQYQNDLGLRLDLAWQPGWVRWFARGWQRLHFATCTTRSLRCEDVTFGGLTHEWSFELGAISADGGFFRPFISVYLQHLGRSERTVEERRVVAQLGVSWPDGFGGRWSASALAQSGDVGLGREDRTLMVGGFFGWSP